MAPKPKKPAKGGLNPTTGYAAPANFGTPPVPGKGGKKVPKKGK